MKTIVKLPLPWGRCSHNEEDYFVAFQVRQNESMESENASENESESKDIFYILFASDMAFMFFVHHDTPFFLAFLLSVSGFLGITYIYTSNKNARKQVREGALKAQMPCLSTNKISKMPLLSLASSLPLLTCSVALGSNKIL